MIEQHVLVGTVSRVGNFGTVAILDNQAIIAILDNPFWIIKRGSGNDAPSWKIPKSSVPSTDRP